MKHSTLAPDSDIKYMSLKWLFYILFCILVRIKLKRVLSSCPSNEVKQRQPG